MLLLSAIMDTGMTEYQSFLAQSCHIFGEIL